MTAIRVTEPSGSNGAIQFANNGVFDTDAGLIFNTTTQRLGVGTATPSSLLHVAGQTIVGSAVSDLHSVTGSLSVSVGLTGSLTHLTDGTSYIIAGDNVTITTGSAGQLTIASTDAAPGDSAASYLVLANTGSLASERALTAGTGISSTDAGAGSSLTLDIDDNIVATVSGSTFTGAVNFNLGLSGSVTHLTDGSSFLLAGPNMVITTGSNGAVTLEAGNVTTVSADTATRTKRTYDLTSGVAANTNYALTQIDLSDGGHDPSYIDVLVNGTLLHSGTAAQVTSGDADYSAINDTTLRFAFALHASDIIDVALITSGAGAADASAPYVTFEASGDLTNERILTAGAGLAVSTAASGEIAMSIDRIKTVYTVTGSQHQSGIPLTVANAAFDSGSYDEHRIDLFVNGQFMVSGSNSDYTLHGSADGVIFNFNLFQNDKVVSIVQ